MGSEESLYSPHEFGARYLQFLETFSFESMAQSWTAYGSPKGVSPEKYFERIVKLHALCGGRVVITSVSPVGSTILLALFAKSDFLAFLRRFPSFLELCCTHDRDVDYGNLKGLRASQVLAELKRTQQADWTSSMFRGSGLPRELSTASMRSVAESILKLDPASGRLDVALAQDCVRSVLKRNQSVYDKLGSRHVALLEAVPIVIGHFINDTSTIVGRKRRDHRYRSVHRVLNDALSTGCLGQDESNLERTVRYIEERCGGDASFSQIISTTDEASDIDAREKRRHLETACYAYNVDLVEGIGATFGSYVQLREGVPVGFCFNQFHSMVLKSDEAAQVKALGARVAAMVGLEFNLDNVSWSDIEAAMSRPPIARSAVEFQGFLQDKRRDYKMAVGNLSLLANHLAELFIERNVKVGSGAPLLLIARDLGIWIGHGAKLLAESFVPVVSGLASAILPLMPPKIKRYVVADTLRAEGEKEFRLIR